MREDLLLGFRAWARATVAEAAEQLIVEADPGPRLYPVHAPSGRKSKGEKKRARSKLHGKGWK